MEAQQKTIKEIIKQINYDSAYGKNLEICNATNKILKIIDDCSDEAKEFLDKIYLISDDKLKDLINL